METSVSPWTMAGFTSSGYRTALVTAAHRGDGRSWQTSLATSSNAVPNPRLLNKMASYDMASTICQALGDGADMRALLALSLPEAAGVTPAMRRTFCTAALLKAANGGHVVGPYSLPPRRSSPLSALFSPPPLSSFLSLLSPLSSLLSPLSSLSPLVGRDFSSFHTCRLSRCLPPD